MQDLARAHVRRSRGSNAGEPYRSYNLGTETGHSVREVIAAVERVAGAKVPAVHRARAVPAIRRGSWPRPGRSAASSASAREHLDLDGIVETAVRWRRDHPKGYGAAA